MSSGCSPKAAFNPKVSAEDAKIIAATNVPYEIIRQCDIYVLQPQENWAIIFSSSNIITKSNLNWEENSITTFTHQGFLKNDEYRRLLIRVDFNTGEILSKEASDSIILGNPDMFYKEPIPVIQKLWFLILCPIVAFLLGALIFYFWLPQRKLKT